MTLKLDLNPGLWMLFECFAHDTKLNLRKLILELCANHIVSKFILGILCTSGQRSDREEIREGLVWSLLICPPKFSFVTP